MADYIEREAAIDCLHFVCVPQCRKYAQEEIKKIPAADVQPVRHGRWAPDYDYTEYDRDGSTLLPEPLKFQDGWQCSLCGQYAPSKTNYCPNCGAKMDGGEA